MWRMDKDWRKATKQEMYGSRRGMKGEGRRWSRRCMYLEEG